MSKIFELHISYLPTEKHFYILLKDTCIDFTIINNCIRLIINNKHKRILFIETEDIALLIASFAVISIGIQHWLNTK